MKYIRIENILYELAYLSTSLFNGSLSHKDLLQLLQPIYPCKRDNLAHEIPFHMLPCSTNAHQSVKTPCIKISGLK